MANTREDVYCGHNRDCEQPAWMGDVTYNVLKRLCGGSADGTVQPNWVMVANAITNLKIVLRGRYGHREPPRYLRGEGRWQTMSERTYIRPTWINMDLTHDEEEGDHPMVHQWGVGVWGRSTNLPSAFASYDPPGFAVSREEARAIIYPSDCYWGMIAMDYMEYYEIVELNDLNADV